MVFEPESWSGLRASGAIATQISPEPGPAGRPATRTSRAVFALAAWLGRTFRPAR